MMPHFDATITLGSILQTIVLVSSIFIAYNGLTNRLVSVETKVEAMWNHFLKGKSNE
jgi:hypothetical protein